jgi:hypothetical protein
MGSGGNDGTAGDKDFSGDMRGDSGCGKAVENGCEIG